jgi:hypothetical protein
MALDTGAVCGLIAEPGSQPFQAAFIVPRMVETWPLWVTTA